MWKNTIERRPQTPLKTQGLLNYQYGRQQTFEGNFLKMRPHGHGRATYGRDAFYEGDWNNGYRHREGKTESTCYNAVDRTTKLSTKYTGGWKDGRRHGHGKLSYPNGAQYEGGFQNGLFHGKGEFICKETGITYCGGFSKGYVSGRGKLKYNDSEERSDEEMTEIWPENSGLTLIEAIECMEKEKKDATKSMLEYIRSIRKHALLADLADDLGSAAVEISTRRENGKAKRLENEKWKKINARLRKTQKFKKAILDAGM